MRTNENGVVDVVDDDDVVVEEEDVEFVLVLDVLDVVEDEEDEEDEEDAALLDVVVEEALLVCVVETDELI